MRIRYWSSDVCSSDLSPGPEVQASWPSRLAAALKPFAPVYAGPLGLKPDRLTRRSNGTAPAVSDRVDDSSRRRPFSRPPPRWKRTENPLCGASQAWAVASALDAADFHAQARPHCRGQRDALDERALRPGRLGARDGIDEGADVGHQRVLAEARLADAGVHDARLLDAELDLRSEEHTSELQSLMRISYAVFCL